MDKGTTYQLHLDITHVCVEVDVEEETANTTKVDMGEEWYAEIEVAIPWCPEKCQKCRQ